MKKLLIILMLLWSTQVYAGSFYLIIEEGRVAIDIEPDFFTRPDPYIVITHASIITTQTSIDFDTEYPFWNFSIKILSKEMTDKIVIKMFDDDFGDDDLLGTWEGTLELLAESGGKVTLDDGSEIIYDLVDCSNCPNLF